MVLYIEYIVEEYMNGAIKTIDRFGDAICFPLFVSKSPNFDDAAAAHMFNTQKKVPMRCHIHVTHSAQAHAD